MPYKLVLIFLIYSCNTKREIFRVAESDRFELAREAKKTPTQKYYRISSADTNLPVSIYPITLPPNLDTVSAIKALLQFRGDQRLCALPVTGYNLLLSSLPMDTLEYYSIQVEALFIINQLYFEKPFNFSPRPVLVQKATGQKQAIGGGIVETAYGEYERWFDKVENIGLSQARLQGLIPLDGSTVSWDQ